MVLFFFPCLDLKSQNMFLMSSGRLRLGDFGIAKMLDGTIAFTRTQVGTPYYLSPEMCKVSQKDVNDEESRLANHFYT